MRTVAEFLALGGVLARGWPGQAMADG